jgi:cyclohexanone monooxygenase
MSRTDDPKTDEPGASKPDIVALVEKVAPPDLGFDPAALKAKYREERDKRLRQDGTAQYIRPKGDFAHFLDDPYVEPGFTRPTLTDEVEVLIAGGGFSALLVGARLRQAGI